MTKYKAGALSAFLSGKTEIEEDEVISESEKKPKKRVKRKSQQIEEALDGNGDQEVAKVEAPLNVEEPSASTRKRRQSYGKLMSDEEKNKTVFVGNLPVDITQKVLKRLFASCGAIETLRLRSAIPGKLHMPKKAAVIKRELSKNQDTIIAYVKFQEGKSVKGALKLNGNVLDGRHIQVDSCASSKRYDDKRTVFLGNLPFDANEERLYEHFSDCGDIEKVRLVRDRASGDGKGFGFVVFKDPTSVSFALKLDGEKFDNRNLRITRVVKKHKRKAPVFSASTKKWQKGETRPNRKSLNRSSVATDEDKKRPSKRVRELVKKRKSKKGKKSYTSTI